MNENNKNNKNNKNKNFTFLYFFKYKIFVRFFKPEYFILNVRD